MLKKIFLTGIMIALLGGVIVAPATAQIVQTDDTSILESRAMERFMEDVEAIAAESHTFPEFIEKLQNLCETNDYIRFPVIQDLFARLLQFFTKERALSSSGLGLLGLLDLLSPKLNFKYFVISFGAYHRLSPRKENQITRFKERLSMWRYSDDARLLKGRTLIFERQPFGIHQKMLGPQLGFMKGFKGIFIDIESRLTGNAYVFFLGRAHRIRAFDLTPLSK